MYHIGFDRILVFVSIYQSGNRTTSEKKCGRILKVKLIFNRKSLALPLSTSVHCVDILFEAAFWFICLFCPTCFFHFSTPYICRFRGNRKDFTKLWPEKQILVNGRRILYFLFCEGFLSRQTSLCGLSFSKFCPISN